MIPLIPSVGTRGLFQLDAPFNTTLIPDVPYTVAAVRRLSDIVATGEDPEEQYYTPLDITHEKYLADLAANVCIVSLQSTSGLWAWVPHTYISETPDIGGIPYTTLALAISLSAIPDSMDLSYLKSRIHDIVLETVGVNSDVNTIVISPSTVISQANHDVVEAARLVRMGTVTTEHAQLVTALRERDSARAKILEYETYINNRMN